MDDAFSDDWNGRETPTSFRPCEFCDELKTGGDLYVGIVGADEVKLDILRRKRLYYRDVDENGDVRFAENPPLETHFGGKWSFTLEGRTGDEYDEASLPPCHGLEPWGCDQIEWGLSSKPFEFTWEIGPDGQAKIYDLSPTGTDLEQMLALAADHSRIFKVYQFDNRFLGKFNDEAGHLLDFEHNPWFTFLPGYQNNASAITIKNNPDFAIIGANTVPALADLFGWKSDTRCYRAQITAFEPVPLFPYHQSTDAANRSSFLHRTILGTLHGTTGNTGCPGPCSTDYWRTSAVLITGEGNAQELLDGRLQSFVSFENYSGSAANPATIDWTIGGRIDFGNYLATYNDRQKTHRLQPNLAYTLENLAGLDWNGTTETVDVASGTFSEGTRFSNGGFLMQRSLSALKWETSFENNTGLEQIRKGDVFYFEGRIFTVSEDGGAAFTPSLHRNLSGETIAFYRHYNPLFLDGTSQPSNGYLGYDGFLNNGYNEHYARGRGITWRTGSEHQKRCLVPQLDPDQAAAVMYNDSTHPDNNATNSVAHLWRYFGRVTKSYQSHALTFSDDGERWPETGDTLQFRLQDGLVSEVEYGPDAPGSLPWKPQRQISYFQPTSLPLPAIIPIDPADNLTEFTYVDAAGGGLNNNLGKVQSKKTYCRENGTPPLDFTSSFYHYDSAGHLTYQDTVAFEADPTNPSQSISPYGHRTHYLRDANTGLPLQEGRLMATIEPDGTVSNEKRLSTTFFDYDYLGRPRRIWDNDARNTSGARQNSDNYRKGPVVETRYHSPMKMEKLAWDRLGSGAVQLSRELFYTDGLDRGFLQLSQLGRPSPFYGRGNTYDTKGRLQRAYLDRTFSSEPELKAVSALFEAGSTPTPYSQSHYNHREERVGQTLQATGDTAGVRSGSWHYRREGRGQVVSYRFFKDKSETGTGRVNIKKMAFDPFGNLETVQDYQQTRPDTIDTWDQAENLITAFDALFDGPTPPFSLSRAQYDSDRFGNVVRVIYGLNYPQTRSFYYDQRNRLRFEHHPEMAPITYSNHDLYGKPHLVESVDRRADFDYDAYGMVRRQDYSGLMNGIQVSLVDSFTYTDLADPFPGRIEEVTSLDQEGRQLIYHYSYDANNGDLIGREMVHNFHMFADFGKTDMASPNWSNALKQSQKFDFHPSLIGQTGGYLGKILEQTYPKGREQLRPIGSEPIITFSYNEKYALNPVEVRERGLSLVLFGDLEYERQSVLSSVRFAGLGGHSYGVDYDFDDQNRLDHQHLLLPDHVAGERDRFYAFDEVGRIESVTHTAGAATPNYRFGYDALGQIKQASQPGFDGNTLKSHTYTYSYKGDSPGNLSTVQLRIGNGSPINYSRTTDAANHLTGPFSYNDFGELIGGRHQNGVDYRMQYNPKGRLYAHDSTQSETYFYDAFGMRVLASRGIDTASPEHTLYFYDASGMVLSEWHAENGDARWDRHHFYLAGQTAATYEYDGVAAGEIEETAQPPVLRTLPPPALMIPAQAETPLIRWGETAGAQSYHLEIVRPDGSPVLALAQIKGSRYSPKLDPGAYLVRIRADQGYWGAWKDFHFVVESRLSHYGMEGNGLDLVGTNHGTTWKTSPTGGVVNNGLNFSTYLNSHLKVVTPTNLPLADAPRTYMGWVKPAGVLMNKPMTLLDFGPTTWPNRVSVQLLGHRLQVNLGDTLLTQNLNNTHKTAVNTWSHWAVTYADGNWKLYLNGYLVGEASHTATTQNGSLYLGAMPPNLVSGQGLNGALDEVEIHNRALSKSEINQAATLTGGANPAESAQ